MNDGNEGVVLRAHLPDALGQARVDIAANVDDLQVGPAMQQLRLAPQGGRADDRALGAGVRGG